MHRTPVLRLGALCITMLLMLGYVQFPIAQAALSVQESSPYSVFALEARRIIAAQLAVPVEAIAIIHDSSLSERL